ncbi:AAA family ATPase [Halarcobacter sp.]|uniref:AAA family ATPase n=1 Tax=Halarcobacter sp. TaxID=2321133 RepID=UPI003A8FD1D4
MRLKYVFIKEYKNLKEFEINFEESNFIDVFVGKNGSGKSNFFEVIIEIFDFIYNNSKVTTIKDFKIIYEIGNAEVTIEWIDNNKIVDGREKDYSNVKLPENVIIYYSGHNKKITHLIQEYEEAFSKKIKGANIEDSRFFIGIGSEYKSILLTLLLLQDPENRAFKYLKEKMDIESISSDFYLKLKRPSFANSRLRDLDVSEIDSADVRTHYWGADGITVDTLKLLEECIKGSFSHFEIYDKDTDTYTLPLNREIFQEKFSSSSVLERFRIFDNLKTIGMLQNVSLELTLKNETSIGLEEFSDGQFQSIYIYAVSEIFKEQNCLTLLDEPDAFLHPEWQFKFMEQVLDITGDSQNHILMSSHSASTITKTDENIISLFEFNGNKIVTTKVDKSDIIKSLSAGLISFSESEADLNIQHVLKNTEGPILFTEGISDEIILETAWEKLYPGVQRNFEIQNAFSCGFLRNLMNDQNIYQQNPGRIFFSLFDFDQAFNDWAQLGADIETDPHKCLAKKKSSYNSYALLLPVPNTDPIKKQVINPNTSTTYGNKSLLTIEHLFYDVPGLEGYFQEDISRTDNFIKFIGDSQKVTFAKDIVPGISPEYFKAFEPIFDFIKDKCN